MANIGDYFIYNDPIKIIWRKGTPDDPYVDKIDNLVIIDNRTVLSEIPDEFHRVQIDGFTELIQNTYNAQQKPSENQFIVNYQNGVVTFHESNDALAITATYKGRGQIQYPAERIYVHSPNPYAVDNLQEFVELAETKIADVNEAIGNAEKATEDAIEATNDAIEATNLTNQAIADAQQATLESQQATQDAIDATNDAIDATAQALDAKDQAIDARNRSILIWQEPVDTRDILEATYPTPEVGWTVLINDSGVVYRYDGAVWRAIGNMTLSTPLASENIDGLISRDDFIKLRDIEEGAQVNYVEEDAKDVLPDYFKTKTMVFVVPDLLEMGTQGIITPFPYNGTIVNISASCEIEGTDSTEIVIEKVSKQGFANKETWTNILSQNIYIDYGERVDDGNFEILDDTVEAYDYFRINVLKAGIGVENLTVTIEIQI